MGPQCECGLRQNEKDRRRLSVGYGGILVSCLELRTPALPLSRFQDSDMASSQSQAELPAWCSWLRALELEWRHGVHNPGPSACAYPPGCFSAAIIAGANSSNKSLICPADFVSLEDAE